MNDKKITIWASLAIICAAAFGIILLFGKFILPAMLPFLIAWGVAMLTRAPADAISDKIGVSKKLIRSVLSVMLMLLLVGGAIFIVAKIASEAWEFFSLATENGMISDFLDSVTAPIGNFFEKLGIPDDLEIAIGESIGKITSGILSKSAEVITDIASAVPKIVFFLFVTAISSVYFSVDLESINAFIHRKLPEKIDSALVKFKRSAFDAMAKYFKSYLIIMFITFGILLVGFMLLGNPYALLLAFITSVFDILPLIGTGIILVPYSVIAFFGGRSGIGIGALVLYAVCTVAREIAEPRIVGKNLGMHPLLTLILLYAGLNIFGFYGLIALPFGAVLFGSAIRQK
jgi:sporulation integral membrane protein YtvI